MLRAVFLITMIGLWPPISAHAQDGKLKALIIGNAHYDSDKDIKTGSQFSSLEPMPVNDVNAMYNALIKSGFDPKEITKAYDLNRNQFLTAIDDFGRRLHPTDRALFYFSGHGFAIGSEDYLVPVGFRFGSTKESTANAAISLSSVLNHLAAANTRVAILDACRDEPEFLARLPKGPSDGAPVRNLVAPKSFGSLIAFAAGAGEPADGRSFGGMSLYTSVLVSSLDEAPVDIEEAIVKTKAKVFTASGQHQSPAFYDELQGGDFPLGSLNHSVEKVEATFTRKFVFRQPVLPLSASPDSSYGFSSQELDHTLRGLVRITKVSVNFTIVSHTNVMGCDFWILLGPQPFGYPIGQVRGLEPLFLNVEQERAPTQVRLVIGNKGDPSPIGETNISAAYDLDSGQHQGQFYEYLKGAYAPSMKLSDGLYAQVLVWDGNPQIKVDIKDITLTVEGVQR